MRTSVSAIALSAVLAGCASLPDSERWRVSEAAEDPMEHVARLTSEGVRGHGSGFWVSDDLVVTNEHVSAMLPEPVVEDVDGDIYGAEVVYEDDEADVAVLRVDGEREGYLDVECRRPGRGEPIAVYGHPYRESWLVTRGYVASDRLPADTDDDLVLLDAVLLPGMSGGPIVDGDGDVVAVSKAFLNSRRGGPSGLSAGVPGDALCDALERGGFDVE